MSLILTNGEPCDPDLWEMFLAMLEDIVAFESCDARTLQHSRRILEGWNATGATPPVDIPATLASFEARGGYCDCEVLMNVADRPLPPSP